MLRKCLSCGTVFEGRNDSTLCKACAETSQASTNIRDRICQSCGRHFLGGPRAWYCPECRTERAKARQRAYKHTGPKRPLGSIDICHRCGKEYIVEGGLQKYCPICRDEAYRELDRAQSVAWNRAHIDYDRQREDRRAAVAPAKCPVCGALFIPTNGRTVCSQECADKRRASNAAAREKEHRTERNYRQRELYAAKKAELSPDEWIAYRKKINAKARAAYRKRKEDK